MHSVDFSLSLRYLVRRLRQHYRETGGKPASPEGLLNRWNEIKAPLQPDQESATVFTLVELAYQNHWIASDAVEMLRDLPQPEALEALEALRRWGPSPAIRKLAKECRKSRMQNLYPRTIPNVVKATAEIEPSGTATDMPTSLQQVMLGLLSYNPLRPYQFPIVVLILTTIAELFTVISDPRVGLLVHIGILLGLLYNVLNARDVLIRRLTITLILIPLIRLVSLGLPLAAWPQYTWYFAASVPLFAAMSLIGRQESWNRTDLGLTLHQLPIQLLVTLTGFGLGWLEYLILRPPPFTPTLTLEAIALPMLILTVSTGFLEELLFRGFLQSAALAVIGRWPALLFVAALFAVLHIGYASVTDVIFVFVVGLAFGIIALKTRSILGVTLAHALTNISLFLLFPHWLA